MSTVETVPPVLAAPVRSVRGDARDDVAVLLSPVAAGGAVRVDDGVVIATDAIPAGHKFAVRAVAAGAPVRRYRAPIGIARQAIAVGAHVDVHNVATALSGKDACRYLSNPPHRRRCAPKRVLPAMSAPTAASAPERARNEANDERAIGIWKCGVTL